MITIRKPVKWHKKSIQINKFNIKQLQSIQDGTLIIFSNGSEEVVIETIDEIKILSN